MTTEPVLTEVTEGTTGRTVLLCRPESAEESPDPEVTWSRGVTLVTVPAAADDRLRWADAVGVVLDQWGTGPIGAVGWRSGGLDMLALAARRPDLVDRLALVATPVPDDLGFDPAEVAAKTLLLYGARDPGAGPRDGKWFQQRMPDRRYEPVPGEGALLLARMWPRVLSHLAPNLRRGSSRRP